MKNFYQVAGLAGCSLALSLSGEAVRAVDLGIDPRFEDRFRVTEFATGLDFPNGIAQLGDGSMVVGTTQGSNFFDSGSTGQLVRLQDTNGDGISDTRTILYDGARAGNSLPGGISAIRAIDNYLFVTSVNSDRISVFKQGADLSANSLTLQGQLDFSFAPGRIHGTSALAVRQTGAQQFELFFNVGASGNNEATPPVTTVSSTAFGLPTTSLTGDSVYKIPLTVGSTLNVASPVLVATGLRNATALEFDKNTGNLYIGENGIDGAVNRNEPLTADELNRLTAAQLANPDVEDFGFPAYGERYRTPGTFVDGNGNVVPSIDPSVIGALVNFQPIPDPNTGFESEGLASLAFAPTTFPNGANNGLLAGFFGRFAYSPTDDRENALVYYDLDTNSYFHLLSANRGGTFGRFTSLLSTETSLFAVDIGPGSGSLFGPPRGGGSIYQLQAALTAQAVPEPSTMLGTALAIGCGAWLKRKVKK